MTLIRLFMEGTRRLIKNEKGQAMVEYGLIIALVAVVLIVVLLAVSGSLGDMFGNVSAELQNPGGGE